VDEFRYLGILFMRDSRLELEMDRWIAATSAVMRALLWSGVVNKLVHVRSCPQLWSQDLGSDQKKEVADTRSCLGHRMRSVTIRSHTFLPNDFNSFFTRFEKDNTMQTDEAKKKTLQPRNSAFTFTIEDVVKALRRTKETSSPGPDNVVI